MNTRTRDALIALAKAIYAETDDNAFDELEDYGSLECHVMDWYEDNVGKAGDQ